MELTIEKAKEIVELYGPHAIEPISQADGFIDGWNQAIDDSVKIIMGSVSSDSGHLLCNKNPYQLAEEINELKFKGEK